MEQEPPGDAASWASPPSHQSLCRVPGGQGSERDRRCFSFFLGDPGIKPVFARFPWAGHCVWYFPIFSPNHSSLRPSRVLSFPVRLLFLAALWTLHTVCTEQPGPTPGSCLSWVLSGAAPPRVSPCTLTSPHRHRRRSPAATSPPVPRFPPSVGRN